MTATNCARANVTLGACLMLLGAAVSPAQAAGMVPEWPGCQLNVVYKTAFNPDSLNKWFRIHGDWQLQDGKLVGTGEGGDIDAWIYAIPYSNSPRNFQIDVSVNMVSGNAEIVFNSIGHWLNEYRVEFWSEKSPAYRNSYNIMRYRDGRVDFSIGNTYTPVRIPQIAHLTVRRQVNTIVLFVNGVHLVSVTDPQPLPAVGMFGLGVIWDLIAKYDNFTVRSADCT